MDYRARFDPDEGGYLVTFPSLPEAITGGASWEKALANAVDALEVTLLTYAGDGRMLPADDNPADVAWNGVLVSPSAQTMAKIAFIGAFRQSGLSRVALARHLGKAESEVRRMLDPYHGTRLAALEDAMRVFGKRLVISVEDRLEQLQPAA